MCAFELYMTRLPSSEINAGHPFEVEAGYRLHPHDPCGTYAAHSVWDCHPRPCGDGLFPWDSRLQGARSSVTIPAHALACNTTYTITYRVAYADPLAHATFAEVRELRLRPRLLPLLPHVLPTAASVPPWTPYRVTARYSRDPSPFPGGGLTFRWTVCEGALTGPCTAFPAAHAFATAAAPADGPEFVVPGTDWTGTLRVTLTFAHAASNRTSQASASLTYAASGSVFALQVDLDGSVGEGGMYHPKPLGPLVVYPQWVQGNGPPGVSRRRSRQAAPGNVTAQVAGSYAYEWTSPALSLATPSVTGVQTGTAFMAPSHRHLHLLVLHPHLQNFTGPHLPLTLRATATSPGCSRVESVPCLGQSLGTCLGADPQCVWVPAPVAGCYRRGCAPAGITFSVPVNAGPQPMASPELQLRVSVLSGTGAEADWWDPGRPLLNGDTLTWAPGQRLEVSTDAWLWADLDRGLEVLYCYVHAGLQVPVQPPESLGPGRLWAPASAAPRAMRRRLAVPLLHPREAVVRFGVGVRDRDGAEYWLDGPAVRILGPDSNATRGAARAPGPAGACRDASSPPSSWHELFAAAAYAAHGPGIGCPPPSPCPAPQGPSSHVLAALDGLAAAWADVGELRHVYAAVASRALLATAEPCPAVLRRLLTATQRLLAVGWLSPPLAALYLAVLQGALRRTLPRSVRPLALRCVALVHAAVAHRTGIGLEVRLVVRTVRGVALATHTRRTVRSAPPLEPIPLGPAWARVPVLDADVPYDVQLTLYSDDVHPVPLANSAGAALGLRWAAVPGPARAGVPGVQAFANEADVEYCFPVEPRGDRRVACASSDAGGAAWRELGPAEVRGLNATAGAPHPMHCCLSPKASDFALLFPTPTPSTTPSPSTTVTPTQDPAVAAGSAARSAAPALVGLAVALPLCCLVCLCLAAGLWLWGRRGRRALTPPRDGAPCPEIQFSIGPHDGGTPKALADPAPLPPVLLVSNPTLPPRIARPEAVLAAARGAAPDWGSVSTVSGVWDEELRVPSALPSSAATQALGIASPDAVRTPDAAPHGGAPASRRSSAPPLPRAPPPPKAAPSHAPPKPRPLRPTAPTPPPPPSTGPHFPVDPHPEPPGHPALALPPFPADPHPECPAPLGPSARQSPIDPRSPSSPVPRARAPVQFPVDPPPASPHAAGAVPAPGLAAHGQLPRAILARLSPALRPDDVVPLSAAAPPIGPEQRHSPRWATMARLSPGPRRGCASAVAPPEELLRMRASPPPQDPPPAAEAGGEGGTSPRLPRRGFSAWGSPTSDGQ